MEWTLWDFVLIYLVIGSPVFCVGRIVQIVILRKYQIKWLHIFLITLLSQAVSLLVAFQFFRVNSLGVILGFVALPALVPEITIVFLTWLFFKFNKK